MSQPLTITACAFTGEHQTGRSVWLGTSAGRYNIVRIQDVLSQNIDNIRSVSLCQSEVFDTNLFLFSLHQLDCEGSFLHFTNSRSGINVPPDKKLDLEVPSYIDAKSGQIERMEVTSMLLVRSNFLQEHRVSANKLFRPLCDMMLDRKLQGTRAWRNGESIFFWDWTDCRLAIPRPYLGVIQRLFVIVSSPAYSGMIHSAVVYSYFDLHVQGGQFVTVPVRPPKVYAPFGPSRDDVEGWVELYINGDYEQKVSEAFAGLLQSVSPHPPKGLYYLPGLKTSREETSDPNHEWTHQEILGEQFEDLTIVIDLLTTDA